jgi:hypothetical protein
MAVEFVVGREVAEGLPWRALEDVQADDVRHAGLVLGRDVDSGEVFLLYGKHALQAVLRSGESASLPAIGIEIDRDTAELEIACKAVYSIKGRCDYGVCAL